MNSYRIGIFELQTTLNKTLKANSIPEKDAYRISEVLLDCELRGHEDHGVAHIDYVLTSFKNGKINKTPSLRVVNESFATALIDGDNGNGIITSTKAMNISIEKTKTTGFSAVGVCNSNYCLAGFPYVMQAAREGFIGFAMSNSTAIMPPPGGITRTFGTNPIAYAIPTPDGTPIILDMATSVTAAAKVFTARSKGEMLPLGLAEDLQGNPITDPHKFDPFSSLILPMSGAKGYGLALLVDVLAGILTGSGFAQTVSSSTSSRMGQFFFTIDVERFIPRKDFNERIASLIRQVKFGKKRENTNEIYLPGERGILRKMEQIKLGYIDIPKATWLKIKNACDQEKIEAPTPIN